MIKTILTYPKDKELLKTKSVKADWEYSKEIIQDLKDTLEASDGVGISAIQIGIPKQICYICYAGKEFAMINPEIVWKRKNLAEFREGCLSVPGKYKTVKRPQKVICRFTDENGQIKEIADGGYMSAIIQHEMSHFNGYCELFEEGE